MKCSTIPKIISALLIFVFCFADSRALAHTPPARKAHAVIQSIDYQERMLTLTYAQEKGPQKLIWNSDTQFLRNRKPVQVTELKQGEHVTVYYHSPFFGKPFATKVVLDGDEQP
jgi:hypothetical protein